MFAARTQALHAPPHTDERFRVPLRSADSATVIELYRKTATALLGSTRELKYDGLEWDAADYRHLGEALRYCGALESLELNEMGIGDADAAAVLAGGAGLASLWMLSFDGCRSLTALPDLSPLAPLESLDLRGIRL